MNSNSSSELTGLNHLSDVNIIEIVFFSIFLFFGGIANLIVLHNLFVNNLYKTSRHDYLLLNLAIADTLVCLVLIPTEIGWRFTGDWAAGNLGCKVYQFFRTFALYLSSLVIICISLDRFYAVRRPFSYHQAGRVINSCVLISWIASGLASIPQTIVFNLEPHPKFPNFTQCISLEFLRDPISPLGRVYNTSSLVIIYFLPLIFILFTYICICTTIYRRTSAKLHDMTLEPSTDIKSISVLEPVQGGGVGCIGHSGSMSSTTLSMSISGSKQRRQRLIQQKILVETILIVVTFLICWTPYVTMTMWYQIDVTSAKSINHTLQNILFLFAVSNSCVNPFIYGKFYRCGQNT